MIWQRHCRCEVGSDIQRSINSWLSVSKVDQGACPRPVALPTGISWCLAHCTLTTPITGVIMKRVRVPPVTSPADAAVI
jgi:hypothetical protein